MFTIDRSLPLWENNKLRAAQDKEAEEKRQDKPKCHIFWHLFFQQLDLYQNSFVWPNTAQLASYFHHLSFNEFLH